MLSKPSLFPLAVSLAAATATAQNTQAHWSSYFGGVGTEDAMVVKRGPGSLLTVVGHADSNGLGTTGTHRPAITGPLGNIDAFVARFDTSLPPALQKLWCTYFGGDAMELAFDAEVDAGGGVTIVGLTLSDAASFTVLGGLQTTRKGPSDGFVARFDSLGVLTYSTYFGSSADDRICAIELDAAGVVTVAGVAEGAGLQVTPGVIGLTHQGGTDAFVARIDPAAASTLQLQWSTYVGGPGNEGPAFAGWGGWLAQWNGVLDAIGLCVEPSGFIVLATSSQSSAWPTLPTTPGCLQPAHASPGLNNIYLARLTPGATAVQYGTFFGAAGNGVRDMVPHPAGGYVLVGQAVATNMPTTPGCYQSMHLGGPHGGGTDGFVCWIDPSPSFGPQLKYASYFGGDGGEDTLTTVAVESSGIITVGGYLSGGFTLRATPGSLQPTSQAYEYTGFIARLAMLGNGKKDLLYGSYLGDAWTVMQSIALDDVGDAVVVGTSYGSSYPTTANAYQLAPASPGLRDAVLTHLPMMSGGSTRFGGALATPACAQPLYHGTFGTPISPNSAFALTATNAPPTSFGLLAFGLTSLPGPVWVPPLGIYALVQPVVFGGTVTSDALGFATYPLPIPVSLTPGYTFESQWVFLTNAACPGTGVFASSEGLLMTTL